MTNEQLLAILNNTRIELAETKRQVNLLKNLIEDSDTTSAWSETVLRKWANRVNSDE